MEGYDLIGDIHGHAQELQQLLKQLHYTLNDVGVYTHAKGRRVIFCGDLIDRGPDAREVLQIVRSMVDNGSALIVMGNHEYNMICYHTWVDGHFLRPHTAKMPTIFLPPSNLLSITAMSGSIMWNGLKPFRSTWNWKACGWCTRVGTNNALIISTISSQIDELTPAFCTWLPL